MIKLLQGLHLEGVIMKARMCVRREQFEQFAGSENVNKPLFKIVRGTGIWDDKIQDLYLDFRKELRPNTWVTSKLITIVMQARAAESCRSKLNLLLFSTTSASIVHLEPRFPEGKGVLVYIPI
jgi:hypothetical protein